MLIKSKVKDIEDKDLDIEVDEELEEYAGKIRATFTQLEEHYREYIYPRVIKDYKNYYGYTGDRGLVLKKLGQSDRANIMFPLIHSIHNTYFSNTYDNETKIVAIPNREEDYDRAEAVQMFNEWAFSMSGTSKVMKEVEFESTLIGSSYAKVGFDKRTEEVQYVKDKKELTNKIEHANPTISYVDWFGMYFNPSATDFYTTPKFYRSISHINDVKKMYSGMLDLSEEQWKHIVEHPQHLSQADYSKIKMLSHYEAKTSTQMEFISAEYLMGLSQRDAKTNADFSNNSIYAVDWQNELVESLEYRDGDNITIMINGYLVHHDKSPYPFPGDPFVHLKFTEESGSMFPMGIASKLSSVQKNVDAFVNNWIDAVNSMVNPAFIADKNVFGQDTPETLRLKGSKVYERIAGKTIDMIKVVDPNAVPNLLNGIQFFIQQAYQMVGLNSYTQGGEGKIERTASGVTNKAQILKTALIPFYQNKNKILSKIGERWMAMAAVYMPDKFTVRVLGEDGAAKFEEISVDDLINKFDLAYDNQSLKSYGRDILRQALIESIQYVQTPELRKTLETKLLETYDMKMPDLDSLKEEIDRKIDLMAYEQKAMQEAGLGQPQNSG